MSHYSGNVLRLPTAWELRIGAATLITALGLSACRATAAVAPGATQEAKMSENTPGEIQDYIDENTVIFNGIRCTASLIKDAKGEPEGALTAQHCVDNEQSKTGLVMKRKKPVRVEKGIDVVDMERVGTVKEFVIPRINRGTDQAVAVFYGKHVRDVLKDYRGQLDATAANKVSPENRFKIWVSGFPYNQDGDDNSNMIRQQLPTAAFATEVASSPVTGRVDIISATAKENSNGAYCTWGMSGAAGLVSRVERMANGLKKRVVKIAGVLSIGASFKAMHEKGGSHQYLSAEDAQEMKNSYHKNYPEVNWEGVDGTCGYAYKPIDTKPGHYEIVKVVTTPTAAK